VSNLMKNHRQARKVRFVLWGSWAAAAACLWWATDLFQTYGLSPGDGGELRAFPDRIRMAVGIALLGLLPAAALTLFAHRYVVGLLLDPTHLRITVVGWGGRKGSTVAVPRAQLLGGRHFHGQLATDRSVVDAPWVTLRVQGKRIPYVLDLQAEVLQLSRIAAVARLSVGSPPSSPGRSG